MMTSYTLQYASCSTGKQCHSEYDESSLVFNTLYTGEETQFLMTEVEANTSFYFRVCKSHCEGEYGPWSLSKRGWTTYPPHGMLLQSKFRFTVYAVNVVFGYCL